MNTNFGKLENGNLTYAPDTVRIGDTIYCTPTAADYARASYIPIYDKPPTPPTGYHNVPTGWEVRDGAIHRVYTQEQDAPVYRKWTPRSIKVACGDKWATVKAALVAADLFDEFVMSQVIDEGCESFTQGYSLACQQFGKEAVDAILNAAEVEA